jgi:hypothetical protein
MHVFLDDFKICNLPNSGRRHEKPLNVMNYCHQNISISLHLNMHLIFRRIDKILYMKLLFGNENVPNTIKIALAPL